MIPFSFLKSSEAVYDPAVLSLTGWWRADYSGAPWAGTASAGSSDLFEMAAGSASPTTGTAQNGYVPADYNGSTQYLNSATASTSFVGSAAGTIIALFKADATPPAIDAQPYNDPPIIGDDAGNMGLTFTSSGVTAFTYVGSYVTKTVACTDSAWHLVMMRWNSTNLGVTLDSAADDTVACAAITHAGNLATGVNYSAAAFYAGLVLELMTIDSALSDGDYANIKSYVNSRYNLAL